MKQFPCKNGVPSGITFHIAFENGSYFISEFLAIPERMFFLYVEVQR